MRVMRRVSIVGMVMLGAMGATDQSSQAVSAPLIKVGETWSFDQTVETGTTGFAQMHLKLLVERITGDTMLVGYKQEGAPGGYEDHQTGTDWSLRIVANGAEVPTARPLAFPMTPGKSWSADFTNFARRGTQISVHVHRVYKVDGWETITVAAGTFHALKIESNGIDQGVHEVPQSAVSGLATTATGTAGAIATQRGGLQTVTERHFSEMYYVPQVKNFVKIVEEQYNADDVRIYRKTQTLTAYSSGS